MSEEKLVTEAAKAFSAGRLALEVKCWLMATHGFKAKIRSPIWSPVRREYVFTLDIEDPDGLSVIPGVGDDVLIGDPRITAVGARVFPQLFAWPMRFIGDDNGNMDDFSKLRVSFFAGDGITPGPEFLQDMFPGLKGIETPKTLVEPEVTELPPELHKDRKLILRTKGFNEYPIEIADFKYSKDTKRYELKVVTRSPQGVNREHFIDRDIQIISQRECLFEGKFECYAAACIEHLGDPEGPDRTLFVSIAAKVIPMAHAPAAPPATAQLGGFPGSIINQPCYTKCGVGVGNPNCVAKTTIPDLEDPEFTKLPTDLELISQIAGRIGTAYPSAIVAEAALHDLEKIKTRLLDCMTSGGPLKADINQVWIQAGICYMITAITNRNIVLHALMPTGRADHGCIQGRSAHVDSIKKSFAYIGSVADAVNQGFIK
jgi:hypothetical protein